VPQVTKLEVNPLTVWISVGVGSRKVASVSTLRKDAADDLETSEWTVIDKITVGLGRTRG
jgi:hypothetical protein